MGFFDPIVLSTPQSSQVSLEYYHRKKKKKKQLCPFRVVGVGSGLSQESTSAKPSLKTLVTFVFC